MTVVVYPDSQRQREHGDGAVFRFTGPNTPISLPVAMKARRLLDQRRVRQISEDTYVVDSLSVPGVKYVARVALDPHAVVIQCGCPATGLCCHGLAAAAMYGESYAEELEHYARTGLVVV